MTNRIVIAVAIALAVAGIVVNVVRPLAPAAPLPVTELDDFATGVVRAARAYRAPIYLAALIALVTGVVVPVAAVWTRPGRRGLAWLAGSRAHAPLRAGLVAIGVTLATTLATLPVAFWSGFVHAGDYGFRTQGFAGWLRDVALGAGISLVVAGLAGVVVAVALARFPRSWPWLLTVVGTALAAVLVLAYPLLVQPLFLETRPLAAGDTRDAVQDVLDAAELSELPILVGDASRRTTMVNAFVTGLGPTREVVVYDNLLELPADQVAVTVAHELAHREHADIPRGTLLTAAGLLPTLLLLRRLLDASAVTRRLESRSGSDPRLIAVVVAFAALAQAVSLPVASYVSRRAEAAADHRAIELSGRPGSLVALARTFTVRDLSLPQPPAWTRVLWGTHPTPSERIRAAVARAREDDLEVPSLADLRRDERDIRHPATLER